MTEFRAFAKAQATAFRDRSLSTIGALIDAHDAAVVDVLCEMQARLAAAEQLLADIASSKVVHRSAAGQFATLKCRADVLARIGQFDAETKARSS